MKTALELFTGFLFEINKFNAPDCTPQEFNYWFNDSAKKFIDQQIESYEATQKETDEFRMLLVPVDKTVNEGRATNVRSIELPEDYYRLVRCSATFRCINDWQGFSDGAKIYAPVRRLTQSMRDLAMDNEYYMPEPEDPYYEIVGNKLFILFDAPSKKIEDVLIESVSYAYIKEPENLELGDDFTGVKESPFPASLNRKILKICVRAFLENKMSPRLQSNVAISNLN